VCSTTTIQSKGCGGPTTYRLHAGASQNDLGKGSDVGSVTLQHCTGSTTQWCAFFTTHVEADCDSLSTRTGQNFPCAPGGYNDNSGGRCGFGSSLPG
jgi:hypothetical protein